MFINLKQELYRARERGYALGAFNTYDLEVTKAICQAAAEANASVIIQTSPSAIDYAGLETLFGIVKNEIIENKVKAAVHLDHAKDYGLVKECVHIGYPSVMIDASRLSYESNVALTHKVATFAKERGVVVEGELGVVGHSEEGRKKEEGKEGEDGKEGKKEYTDVDMVPDFVARTKIDILAVSVGNEHGAPQGEKLDLELLRRISKVSKVPLAMHGSSGLSKNDIKEAIKLGVVKFNIDTKLKAVFIEELRNIKKSDDDPRDVLEEAREAVKSKVAEYIGLFGGL